MRANECAPLVNFSLLGEIDLISEYLIIAQGKVFSVDKV